MAFVESEVVELKAEIVGDICKEVIAFANTKGGTLYIGVSNDGSVVGVKNADRVILQMNNMIRDSIKPDVTMFVGYEAQHVSDKDIIAVTIQKGTDRPYYLSSKGLKPSGVYVRNGTSSDPATDTAIRRMIKETDGDSFESTWTSITCPFFPSNFSSGFSDYPFKIEYLKNPFFATFLIEKWLIWAVSSAGRARRSHRRGRGFDPLTVHQNWKSLWFLPRRFLV